MTSIQYREIPVAKLRLDTGYQRDRDARIIKAITAGFDEALFLPLEVARRNGHFYVYDGGNRYEAAKILKFRSVWCRIAEDTSPQEEARRLVALQEKRRAMHPLDKFKAAVFQCEPEAVAITAILSDFGVEMARLRPGSPRRMESVGAARRVYRRGQLRSTLTLIENLWAGDQKAYNGVLVEGLARLDREYGDRVDDDAFERLRELAPYVIIRRAQPRMTSRSPEGQALGVAKELRAITRVQGRPRSATSTRNG